MRWKQRSQRRREADAQHLIARLGMPEDMARSLAESDVGVVVFTRSAEADYGDWSEVLPVLMAVMPAAPVAPA